jgi:hypothetical protein
MSVVDPPPPENMGAISNEYGESFHQDIFQMEKMYSGKWSFQYVGRLLLESYKGDSKWHI